MSHLTKAKWKCYALYIPCAILMLPFLIVLMGLITVWQQLSDTICDELRWGAFVDDSETRKDKNHCPRPGLVWDERQQYWVDQERIQ